MQSSPLVRVVPLRVALLAVALALCAGLAAGVIASLDPFWSHSTARLLGMPSISRSVPYLFSAIGVALGLAGLVLGARRKSLWSRRGALVITPLLMAVFVPALGKGPLDLYHGAVVFVLGMWLFDQLTHPGRSWSPSGFAGLVLLFGAWSIFSTLGRYPLDIINAVLRITPLVLAAFLIVHLLSTPERVRTAVRVMIATAALVAVAGIAQVGVWYFFGIEFSLADQDRRYAITPFGPILRATALSHNANEFSGVLGTMSLVTFALVLSGRGRESRSLLTLAILLMWLGALLSIGRASWIAITIGLLAFPFVVYPRRTPLWISLLLLFLTVGSITGAIPWVVTTINNFSTVSVTDRAEMLAEGLRITAETPWRGVGFFLFAPFSPTLDRWPVHNAPVQITSELGIPGLFIFLTCIGWVALRLMMRIRTPTPSPIREECAALFAGLVVLLVHIQAENFAFHKFLWAYLAVCEAAARSSDASRTLPENPMGRIRVPWRVQRAATRRMSFWAGSCLEASKA